MKIKTYIIAILVIGFLGALSGLAQTESNERAVVKFSDPAKPGLLKVHLIMGGITLSGYEGSDVIIEAKVRERKIIANKPDVPVPPPLPPVIAKKLGDQYENQNDLERAKKREAARQGLKKLTVSSTNLLVEEKDNVMGVEINSFMQTVDLTIKVPRNTSLKLTALNAGVILVDNVNGEVEVETASGSIKLTGISGTVVASTTHGDVTASFTKLTPGKPMAFSTFTGDVDITIPADTKATVKLKSDRGDVYSDFDMKLEERSQKKEERHPDRDRAGRYRLVLEKTVFGSINGGGPEFSLSTLNGDIYVRKGK